MGGGGVTRKGRSLCLCCFCFAKGGKSAELAKIKKGTTSAKFAHPAAAFPRIFAREFQLFPNPILGLENFFPVCLCPPPPLSPIDSTGEGGKVFPLLPASLCPCTKKGQRTREKSRQERTICSKENSLNHVEQFFLATKQEKNHLQEQFPFLDRETGEHQHWVLLAKSERGQKEEKGEGGRPN